MPPIYVLPHQDPVEIDINEEEENVVITQHFSTGDEDSMIFIHKTNMQRFIDALVEIAKQS